jgi:hypothetical protein
VKHDRAAAGLLHQQSKLNQFSAIHCFNTRLRHPEATRSGATVWHFNTSNTEITKTSSYQLIHRTIFESAAETIVQATWLIRWTIESRRDAFF